MNWKSGHRYRVTLKNLKESSGMSQPSEVTVSEVWKMDGGPLVIFTVTETGSSSFFEPDVVEAVELGPDIRLRKIREVEGKVKRLVAEFENYAGESQWSIDQKHFIARKEHWDDVGYLTLVERIIRRTLDDPAAAIKAQEQINDRIEELESDL